MDDIERDITLLSLFLGEDLPKEDRETISQWLAASKENRLYYKRMKIAYLRQRWFFRQKLIQEKPAWSNLVARRRHQVLFRKIFSVAASIILVCGLFVLWELQGKREKRQESLPIHAIVPGSPKANLFLSTGKKVSLEMKPLKIQEQGDLQVAVTQSGKIDYTKNEEKVQREEVLNRLIIERGGEYCITFSDGSMAWLNSSSELEYPIVFVKDRRIVRLKGEAYFKVQSDTTRPFIVIANGCEIEVTGTEFNVNTRKDNEVETVLVNGGVCLKKGHLNVQIQPSQRVVCDVKREQITLKEYVDVWKYVAWREGDFVFVDDRLEDVLDKLALWYDFDIFFANQDIKEIRLTGDMKRYAELKDLLHFFGNSTDLKFEINGKALFVKRRVE